jgi:hypothetical protein
MRSFLAALFLCLAGSAQAQAKPDLSGEFGGDRWRIAQAGTTAADVNRTMTCPPPYCARVKVKRKWKKRYRPPGYPVVKVKPAPVPLARPKGAPEADAEVAATNAVWERIAESLKPRRPLNIFEGFAREIARALPGRSLVGVVGPLAVKAQELVDRCGSRVISAVRKTYVAGTRRISLHASGRAVDMAGNPACMYALLRKWPGGVSVDYGRVRHIHVSYAPPARGQRGREWGARFAHRGGTKRTRYARHHRKQYASAR